MYWGRIGIELFKGAMISHPADRLGLFAILVNEAANYSTKPALSALGLSQPLTQQGLNVETHLVQLVIRKLTDLAAHELGRRD